MKPLQNDHRSRLRPLRLMGLGLVVMAGLGSIAPIPRGTAQVEDRFAKVEVKAMPLREGVYVLFGAGGNIGVFTGPDGTVLVDDQFAELTPKIKATLADLGIEDVRFLLNTHWHFDHTGGNENFGNTGTAIVAHDNVYKRMSTDQVIKAFGRPVAASPKAALPIVTFDQNVRFRLNDDTLSTYHMPHAHTDGDAIVHFEAANVIHMGDIFFNGRYPFIDVGSGGHVDGVIKAAKFALNLSDADTLIIPGHGPLGKARDLQAYHDMLVGARAAVASLVAAGKSRSEVIAAKPTKSFDQDFGVGGAPADGFVGFIYDSLASKGHSHADNGGQ